MLPSAMNRSLPPSLLRRPLSARHLALLFVAACAGVFAVAAQVVAVAPGTGRQALLDAAVTTDLTVVVPALWYLLVARPRGWSATTVLPVFVAAVAVAGFILPSGRRQLLDAAGLLAAPAELVVLWLVVRRVRRIAHASRAGAGAGDTLQAIREATRQVLGPSRLADALAYEFALLRYAFVSWRAAPETRPDAVAFTYHRRSGYPALVGALILVICAEGAGVHVMLRGLSPTLAWTLTALSAYSILWLVGDARAASLRPILLSSDELLLRLGLRWTVRVPREAVTAVGDAPLGSSQRNVDLCLALPGRPWFLVELAAPVEAVGLYGRRKLVRRIGVSSDDPARLREALGALPRPDRRDA